MFSKKIIDTDWFMDMPQSAQNLYFHLSMRADDDGFVDSPQRICRMVGSSNDDYRLLIAKSFIIPFESGICVIKDWRINNYLRSDRYTPTTHTEERSQLSIEESGAYIVGIPQGIPSLDTKSNTKPNSKSILLTNSDEEYISKKKKTFTPPTYEEVLEYAQSRNRADLAKKFFDYFTTGNWVDSNGKRVRNWKQKFITWEQHNATTPQPLTKDFDTSVYDRPDD